MVYDAQNWQLGNLSVMTSWSAHIYLPSMRLFAYISLYDGDIMTYDSIYYRRADCKGTPHSYLNRLLNIQSPNKLQIQIFLVIKSNKSKDQYYLHILI